MTETKSLWRVTGAELIRTEPDIDVIAVTVKGGPGNRDYAVTCAGHRGMLSTEFITAIRAAAAGLLAAVGGDLSQVDAETMEGSKFDTGTQRPS